MSVPHHQRTINCVDTDKNALDYAQSLLNKKNIGDVRFINENAFRFTNAKRNINKYGHFNLIYSAGLFDYIPTDKLIKLLNSLYNSLSHDGKFLIPFKEKIYYDTFEYHWYSKWFYFFQRTKKDFDQILEDSGIPQNEIKLERDDSGVILFYVVDKV